MHSRYVSNGVIYLVVTLLLLPLIAVWPRLAAGKEIRIGIVTDQSGINAEMARDYVAGARTYFDHVNSGGGINGRKLTVIIKDDEGLPAKTVRLTRDLIEVDQVDVLFGYMGDENVTAVSKDAYFNRSRVTLVAPLAGIELTGASNVFFFRPAYREEAQHVVRHFHTLGAKEFLIVAAANPIGGVMSAALADVLRAQGTPAIAQIALDPELRNIDAVTREIASRKPQIVVVAGDTLSTAGFLRRYRTINTSTSVVGFSNVNHRTLMEMVKPDLVAGTMLTQVVPPPNANQTKLQSEHLALMKVYRDEPPSHITLEGFAAAKTLTRALVRSRDISRANIAAAFAGERKVDLDGMLLVYGEAGAGANRGSAFVDLAILRKNGQLIQ